VSVAEQEIDRLFGLPLDEFTAARNELARRLKSEGEAEPAAAVQALSKPTVAAWTINQLARGDSKAVQALLAAGDALRTAQRRLLGGEDASSALRDASAREREAVAVLTRRAESVLKKAGRPATQAVVDRIARTLRAAALTDGGRRLLEAGRLTTELEPPGFEELAGVEPAQRRRRATRATAAAEQRREREQEARRKGDLREQARLLERAAREAEREVERAEAVAEEARRRAAKARAEADAAAEQAAERR
jgi:hypothetical protein